MTQRTDRRLTNRLPWTRIALAALLWSVMTIGLAAQTDTATPSAPGPVPAPTEPVAPGAPSKGGDLPKAPATSAAQPSVAPKTPLPPPPSPGIQAPAGGGSQGAVTPNQPQPGNAEGENGAPGLLDNAALEEVEVPARPVVMIKGTSSYDDAFKSIKGSLDQVQKAMEKAGLKPSGHPITIFSEPDDKGFKYEAAIPVAQVPAQTDLGDGVSVGTSPAGKAIKFQHRNDYDSIDSTYDAIAAYLDAKGILASNPYVEEYLTPLTTADDPNLQVDIYVFVKDAAGAPAKPAAPAGPAK